MEFKEVMIHYKRMCKSIQKGTHCQNCPLGSCNNGKGELCDRFLHEYPSEAEQIILKWAEEHPAKTIKDDFLEKHPKAQLDSDGTPRSCAKYCGYCTECIWTNGVSDCKLCWNRPMED